MNKNLSSLAKIFQKNNKHLYIVGGFCREKILGIDDSQTDIDLSTDALPNEVENFTQCIWHIGKKYGTLLISHNWETYETTSFRSDIWILDNRKPVDVKFTTDIHLDAKRRDFTCNAVYFDILKNNFIDPEWGKKDIENNILRFVGNPEQRIQEDALRILRFIRFKNKYNFIPAEKNYFPILSKNISLLKNISKERIKQELDKILIGPNNTQALKDLKEIGFFQIFLQEIDKQSDTPGNSHHLEWDVWTHTLMTIEHLNTMNLEKYSTQEKIDFYWTLLLHDITKPMCYHQDEKWEWHYYGHERSWAEYVKSVVSKQLPFSKKSLEKIIWIIENHLRIFKVFEMKTLKSRTLMMHKYWKDLMIVAEADHMGRIPASFQLIEKLHNFYAEFLEILSHKNFKTWQDIMQEYPQLQWAAIGQKLQEINNNILTNDDV